MKFPNENDFLEEFGIAPVEVDPSLALLRYVIKGSAHSQLEIDVSFSAVMESFQVVLRAGAQALAVVSSENVQSIELFRDKTEAGLRVVFDIHGSISEARVIFEPEISFRWWTLCDE